jgi:hypothetical protein
MSSVLDEYRKYCSQLHKQAELGSLPQCLSMGDIAELWSPKDREKQKRIRASIVRAVENSTLKARPTSDSPFDLNYQDAEDPFPTRRPDFQALRPVDFFRNGGKVEICKEEFRNWLEKEMIELPSDVPLSKWVTAQEKTEFLESSQPSPKVTKPDKRKQVGREIAQELWEKDPTRTTQSIHRSGELIKALEAIEETPPSEDRFRDWVSDLNPNPHGGRPRKKP